jgi:ABC-type Zn uptake system ZnuABC Zn-binding protein ZnuA
MNFQGEPSITVPSQSFERINSPREFTRRPGWVYLNIVFAMFLAFAALSACADTNNDDAAESGDDSAAQPAAADDTTDDAVVDANGEPLNVVVTMPFFPSMVEAVGGNNVDVESIVPQGVDAHTYQPTPSDAQMIADADIIFVNGFGLEEFLAGLIESAGGVDAPIYELADGLQDEGIGTDDHHHDDDHADDVHHDDDHADDVHHDDDHADDVHHDDDHADDVHHDDDDHADDVHHDDDHADDVHHDDDDHADDVHHDDDDHADDDHGHSHDYEYGNPHFWLDPTYGMHYVENIYEGLAEVDPDNESIYRSNADDYIAEIEAFDEWAQDQMAQIPDENRFMVTFHDAFPYFAEHYNLEVVGVVITSPGREPGAQELAQLADEIREVGVPAVFIEPQFNPSLAEAIADEAGVEVHTIYSDTPPEDAGYLDMMELNIERVVEGLS